MAQNIYQATIQSIEPTADGMVHADCFVQVRGGTSPDFTWTLTSQGHFTLVFTATEIEAVINNPANTTTPLKRQALRNMVKEAALARGVDQADQAFADWSNLITFPDSVTIR